MNFGLTNISGTFGTCNTTITTRVSQSASVNLTMNSTKDNLVANLDSGFGLTWDASINLCKRCNETGGQCGYNTSTTEFTCYCKDGPNPSNCAGRLESLCYFQSLHHGKPSFLATNAKGLWLSI
ncbi:LEAF RUST 10 DISEASE-RESISTANCE LOCUS RECEPTOR-LIKE PROTEIN KINASE-like 1.3 isoform X1 [Prunus yedoensis var. nudiflora]|uniref:LEAF RUST 10 DISEASE-RESISTANCE LOCUS RECEPTOR-LIKE PROTEIN KINASE-like 1.3 isoform X1 n=1 Tax=Prunus yedoensis var. nudiflora TaxID=2094558 RepID=A0A314Z379_PRUYE|nr:LEAF RUST 10 DISEASE-RESISTANCE LOCUS RECEPTOR-LIKE PROTEIN KINASE-like 1.3 isoform X1 [Prunus yedoensis var. nudiflora]